MPVSWEVRLSFLADCVRTRHRRAYPDMDFVRDEIAGVVDNTELIIHRGGATSCRGLHAAVVPSGYQWLLTEYYRPNAVPQNLL